MIEALNRADIPSAVAHFDPAILNHGQPVGLDGMQRVFEAQRMAFPDWHHDVAQAIADGPTVVTRSFLSGTHQGRLGEPMASLLFHGALRGLEPTGRTMRIQAIHIWEVGDNGLITAHWANRDDLGMRAQLTAAR